MKRRTIRVLSLPGVLLSIFPFLPYPAWSQSDITVDWLSRDFGSITVGNHVMDYLTVTNAGTSDLVVSGVTLSGTDAADFSVENGGAFTLAAGNGRQIGVKFSPTGTGARTASLDIVSNDPDENPLTLAISGTGSNETTRQWVKIAELASGTVNDLAVMGADVFAGTDWGGVLRSADHGATWSPVNDGLTHLNVRAILVSGSTLYAGTWGGGVFFSADKGAHWTPISSGMTNLDVSCLAIDPPGLNGNQRLLAGTWGGGAFVSVDHGLNWTVSISGMTETHVRSVLVSGSHLFAGTIDGLFRSSDGQAWTAIHNGLTRTAVISLSKRAGNLIAGTQGGGVFFSENDGDAWAGYFLNGADAIVPDLTVFANTHFAATWGLGVHRKTENGMNDNPEEGLTEPNVRSLAVVPGAGTGEWNILAGTEQGNIWLWPLEADCPVVVDGEKDAFYDGLAGPDEGFLRLRSYAWNNNGSPDSDDDLSASIWTSWDDDWFYLYEEVADNMISGNAVNVWEEDCIEVLFDPRPESAANSIWSTRLTALDDANPDVAAWDDMNDVAENASRQWTRKTTPGGYVLELAVQWQAIRSVGEAITPATGTVFGLAINQHDNDGDARRSATVQWAAVLDDRVWNTPNYLGTVELLDDHKMRFSAVNAMSGVTNPVPYDGSDYTRTGIRENASIPRVFHLEQNYPNPFNPGTIVAYELPDQGDVRLTVLDVRGREVAVLEEGVRSAGIHRVPFDGSGLESGVYFSRLEAGARVSVRKMMLVK